MKLTKRPIAAIPVFLLSALLCADVASFMFEKMACNRAGGEGWRYLANILRQPWFWANLAMGPIQLWTWTRILSRVDLSRAYPITGLNMPLTVVAATVLLGERLPWEVWTGALLITVGGAIIGPGGSVAHHPPQTPPG
jgi:drug/metabolite transporter (DMT)-like permease